MTTAFQDPRPIADALQQPEIDKASLNDVLEDCGWELQAVNWIFEQVTGNSLVATIITPITGDWSKIRADGDAWRNVGTAMNDMSYNLTANVATLRDSWDGEAAKAHERYIALGWKAGLFAEMGIAHLIAKGFDTVAEGAEALGKQAARLLDYLVKKLVQAAATVWVPVAGWLKAAEMVWNAYQIYQRVMDIIETIKKLITDVKALFDAVGNIASALGKLKDADSLAEAMNATQEVAEGVRDARNSVNDIKDGVQSVKDSATEIGERGRDIGGAVRDYKAPTGAGDSTAPSQATQQGGPAVSAPPPVNGGPDTTTPSSTTPGGPAVHTPPTTHGPGPGSTPGGPTHTAPPVRNDTTHAQTSAPVATHPTPSSGPAPSSTPHTPPPVSHTPAAGPAPQQTPAPRPSDSTGTSSTAPPRTPTGTPGTAPHAPAPRHGESTPSSHTPTTGTTPHTPSSQTPGSTPGASHTPGSPGTTPHAPGSQTPGSSTPGAQGTSPHTPGSSTPHPGSTPGSSSTPHTPGTTPHTPGSTPGSSHTPGSTPHTPGTTPHTPSGHDSTPPSTRPDTPDHTRPDTPADHAKPDAADHTKPDTPSTKDGDNTPSSGADHTPHETPDKPHDQAPDTPRDTKDTPADHTSGDHGDTPPPSDHRSGDDGHGKGEFDNQAMRDGGPSYHEQLNDIIPNADERREYEEMTRRPSHELTEEQARRVVDVRSQLTADEGSVMTKALRPDDVQKYFSGEYGADSVTGFVARGQDVADVNTPEGLHHGLALNDEESRKQGWPWSPIPDPKQDSAIQLRWAAQPDDGRMPVAFGAQKGQDATADMMQNITGQTPVRGDHPYTGTGHTGGGVPEWRANGVNMGDRAEMWQVNKDGSESLYAYYTRENGGWKLAHQ